MNVRCNQCAMFIVYVPCCKCSNLNSPAFWVILGQVHKSLGSQRFRSEFIVVGSKMRVSGAQLQSTLGMLERTHRAKVALCHNATQRTSPNC